MSQSQERGKRRREAREREKLGKVWVREILEQLCGVREWGKRGEGLLRNVALGYKWNPL